MAEKQKAEQPRVLLTQDDDGKLKAVTGVDEKSGKLKTADPTRENAGSFLQFDTHGNPLENFMKRFAEQSRNPSHTAGLLSSNKKFFEMIIFAKIIHAHQ
jgi:hypothetical protein